MSHKHTPYFNLLDALRAPGCALCNLGRAAIDRFLDTILYEYVNDTGTQKRLTAAHGFCPTHGELLLGRRSAVGIAILYNAVLGRLEAELPSEQAADAGWMARLAGQLGRGEAAGSLLAARSDCLACQTRDGTGERALSVWREHYDDPSLAAALQTADAFCLPHLRQALRSLDGPPRQMLLTHQRQAWQTMRAQLAEFLRKNDYRFQHEAFGVEEDVWRRAVRAISGEPGVF